MTEADALCPLVSWAVGALVIVSLLVPLAYLGTMALYPSHIPGINRVIVDIVVILATVVGIIVVAIISVSAPIVIGDRIRLALEGWLK